MKMFSNYLQRSQTLKKFNLLKFTSISTFHIAPKSHYYKFKNICSKNFKDLDNTGEANVKTNKTDKKNKKRTIAMEKKLRTNLYFLNYDDYKNNYHDDYFKNKRVKFYDEGDSFPELVNHDSFIDKTGLIQKLLFTKRDKFIISQPRSGKSTMLNTLKHFFSPDKLTITKIKDIKKIDLHSEKKELGIFKNTTIGKLIEEDTDRTKYEFSKKFGKFPVVLIDLYGERGNNSYRNFLKQRLIGIKLSIKKLNDDTNNLFEIFIKKNHINLYKLFQTTDITLEENEKESTESELKMSLLYLVIAVSEFYNLKEGPVVLIDEFDHSISNDLLVLSEHLRDQNETEYNELKNVLKKKSRFITNFISNICKKNLVHQVIICGTMDTSEISISSSLNNLKFIKANENDDYSEYLAFTHTDVQFLINKIFSETSEINKTILLNTLKYMYNGIEITNSQNKCFELYSPFSIINCLDNLQESSNVKRIFKNYLPQNTSDTFLYNLANSNNISLNFKRKIEILINNFGTINTGVNLPHNANKNIFENILDRNFEKQSQEDLFRNNEELATQILITLGYIFKTKDGKFKISNREVCIFLMYLLKNFRRKLK